MPSGNGNRLRHQPAEAIEVDNTGELPAKPGGTCGEKQGILEPASQELSREILAVH
jgi:hypothetical protein